MADVKRPLLSIVVPLYNESEVLPLFHDQLMGILGKMDHPNGYEIIYCDDGSVDDTAEIVHHLREGNPKIRLVSFTRNFGKEIATTAGIHEARGQAIVTLDADGQHPVNLIPEFTKRWMAGNKVVIGRRTSRQAGMIKRLGSKFFYGTFRRLMGVKLDPDATDFRLIDRQVQLEFNRMTERNRITRGLVNWMGYKPAYVQYEENERLAGTATQSFRKLVKLAIDSAISLSVSPLYIVAYIGAVVLPVSVLLGLFMCLNALFGDPAGLHATGGAYLIVLLLFLMGILLVSQGIIGLYLSHIHTETQNRPLYVIDESKSEGV
jgi:glycosyltransferase involved in cell wall biosynthesis